MPPEGLCRTSKHTDQTAVPPAWSLSHQDCLGTVTERGLEPPTGLFQGLWDTDGSVCCLLCVLLGQFADCGWAGLEPRDRLLSESIV